jgi:hypothetical protein
MQRSWLCKMNLLERLNVRIIDILVGSE